MPASSPEDPCCRALSVLDADGETLKGWPFATIGLGPMAGHNMDLKHM